MGAETGDVEALRPLAAMLKAKMEVGEPYLLCLGEGATLSSGCRDMRWAVRTTIRDQCPWVLDDVLAGLGRSERVGEDSEKFDRLLETISEEQWYPPLRREFFNVLDHRRGGERRQALSQFLSETYPSTGYNFLALLVREGFFNVIFNANYDPLLENALRQYLTTADTQDGTLPPFQRLVNRPYPEVRKEIEEAFAMRRPRVKVLWLHGHIWEPSGIAFTPREKRDWYGNIKDVIEEHFGQDLLLIGYTDRDADIRRALENATGDGTVWYVAEEDPRGDIDLALQARKHSIISGPAADFDPFCQMLFDLALNLAEPQKVDGGDIRRLGLLKEKLAILQDYVYTLERRQREDPMAPKSLEDQRQGLQEQIKAVEEVL
jgi:hypothetical protein